MATTSTRQSTVELVYSALADERRREVLRYLRARGGSVDVEHVAAYVATRTGRDESTVRTMLHHAHLPKLDQAELVSYQPEAGDVAARETTVSAESLAALPTEVDSRGSGG